MKSTYGEGALASSALEISVPVTSDNSKCYRQYKIDVYLWYASELNRSDGSHSPTRGVSRNTENTALHYCIHNAGNRRLKRTDYSIFDKK